MALITEKDVEKAYKKGILKIIDSPIEKSGCVCQIAGEITEWFYFGDNTTCDLSAKEYLAQTEEQRVIQDIFKAIDDMDDDIYNISSLNAYDRYKKVLIPPAQETIRIKTPVGYLIVEAKGAVDEYPGVYVYFSEEEEARNQKDLVTCVEYNTEKKEIVTISYNRKSDEPVKQVVYDERRK